jgi:hypothetical protein
MNLTRKMISFPYKKDPTTTVWAELGKALVPQNLKLRLNFMLFI